MNGLHDKYSLDQELQAAAVPQNIQNRLTISSARKKGGGHLGGVYVYPAVAVPSAVATSDCGSTQIQVIEYWKRRSWIHSFTMRGVTQFGRWGLGIILIVAVAAIWAG